MIWICDECLKAMQDKCEKDISLKPKTECLIAYLEKIKEETETRVKLNNDLENYDIATGLSMALGILDRHIYELKGEQK